MHETRTLPAFCINKPDLEPDIIYREMTVF